MFATATDVLQEQWQDPVGDNRMEKNKQNPKRGFKIEVYKIFTKTISESNYDQLLLTGKTKVHSAWKHIC